MLFSKIHLQFVYTFDTRQHNTLQTQSMLINILGFEIEILSTDDWVVPLRWKVSSYLSTLQSCLQHTIHTRGCQQNEGGTSIAVENLLSTPGEEYKTIKILLIFD